MPVSEKKENKIYTHTYTFKPLYLANKKAILFKKRKIKENRNFACVINKKCVCRERYDKRVTV